MCAAAVRSWKNPPWQGARSNRFSGQVTEEVLYTNSCIIEYPLPPGTEITEEKGVSDI